MDNSVNGSTSVSSGNNSENVSGSADNDPSNDASFESGSNASDGVSDATDESDNSDVVDNSDEDNTSNGSENSDESDESDNNGASDDSSNESNSSEEESTEPEVLGSGTEEDPYLAIPDEDMHVVTVNIPAGKDVYYSIYRVGGMNLKIKSSDVYVIYEGKTYNPKSGTLSLSVESALASDAISFRIGNNGSTEQPFELVFASPTGTYMNPTVVKNLKEEKFIELEANDEFGHYYKYTAEKDGTIRFAMSATADSEMLVTNNRNSAQRTTEADGSTDSDGVKYVEIEVKKGDEIIINVGAIPNRRGKYPATDITWSAEYK